MKKPGQPRALRARLAEVCGRIGGHAAIRVLREHLRDPEEMVRDRAMTALTMCKYHATGAEAAAVKQLVREEAADAAWALAAVADLSDEPVAVATSAEAVADAAASSDAGAETGTSADPNANVNANAPHQALGIASGRVVEALLSQVRRSQDRVLTLLSFIYPGDSMLQSKLWLASESGEKRASALEVIDNLLAPDLKALALPLLDDVTPRERLARLGAHFPQPRLGPEARLREIVTRPQSRSTCWTKACALYALGRANARGFDDAVVPSLGDPDPVVRETAAWVLFTTGSAQYREHVQRLRNDPSRLVARVAERLESLLPTRGLGVPGGTARRTPARVDHGRQGRAREEGAGGQAVTEVPAVGASLGGEGLSGGLAGGEPPGAEPAGGKKE